jgi:hypothetical protein
VFVVTNQAHARALRTALDFDRREAGGSPAGQAMAVTGGREGWYDPEILEACAAIPSKKLCCSRAW